jgi:hypothetical protein
MPQSSPAHHQPWPAALCRHHSSSLIITHHHSSSLIITHHHSFSRLEDALDAHLALLRQLQLLRGWLPRRDTRRHARARECG